MNEEQERRWQVVVEYAAGPEGHHLSDLSSDTVLAVEAERDEQDKALGATQALYRSEKQHAERYEKALREIACMHDQTGPHALWNSKREHCCIARRALGQLAERKKG